MARYSDASKELQQLLKMLVPQLRNIFLDVMQGVSNDAILKDVIKAIELGDLEKAYRAIGFNDAAMRPITKFIEDAFEKGGVTVGNTFPKRLNTEFGKVVFRFDVRNSRAEAWLREQSSRLVTETTENIKQVIRNVTTQGMTDGRNPRNVALDLVGRKDAVSGKRIGGSIGLTSAQERWVSRTNTMLLTNDPAYFTRALRWKRGDAIVAAAIASGKPLPQDVIDKLVSQYRDNALRYRGEVIARTEMLRSLNRSEWEALTQAVDMGALNKSDIKRVWDSAGNDGRTRPSHLAMDNHLPVGIDEPFIFPNGVKVMYPGDVSLPNDAKALAAETIQCRCKSRTVVDWYAGAKDVDISDDDRAAIKALAAGKLPGDA